MLMTSRDKSCWEERTTELAKYKLKEFKNTSSRNSVRRRVWLRSTRTRGTPWQPKSRRQPSRSTRRKKWETSWSSSISISYKLKTRNTSRKSNKRMRSCWNTRLTQARLVHNCLTPRDNSTMMWVSLRNARKILQIRKKQLLISREITRKSK